MNDLSESALARLARALNTKTVGRPLLARQQIGSTNDLARAEARAGHGEGLVVLAEEQTAGRGRLGRGWAAPPGTSLLLSLLLRPTWLPADAAFALTMLAAVGLCEAVEAAAPVPARLKWPNDLLLDGPGGEPRKAAGILSELALEGGAVAWAVIGMGVNVNWSPSGLVDGRDLGRAATSLSAAAGQPIDRAALLAALLERLDLRYHDLRRGRREALFEAWRARLTTLGQRVTVHTPGGELQGLAEAVEPSGALRLRDDAGTIHLVMAGDVGA